MADPLQPPPPGEYIPVFNRRDAALGITIPFTVLAWLCSLLRLYTRFLILRQPWWDDLFMALALVTSTAGSVVFWILAGCGNGKHLDSMVPDEANAYVKTFYAGSVTYPAALTFIKLALLFQYLRLFDVGSKRRRFSKGLIIFTSIWGIVFCIPAWCWGFLSRDRPQALGFFIAQSVTTTLIDLVIFLLPLHLFFQPGTQRRIRIALLCLFFLGVCVSFCSIARLVYSLTPTLDALWDLSWTSPTPVGLSTIEINLASICGALPVFWPVIRERWSRIFVTYEVTVTRESGIFVPRRPRRAVRESPPPLPRSTSSSLELTPGGGGEPGLLPKSDGSGATEEQQLEWDPYVGDSKTGLGESDTIVQSPAEGPPVRKALLRDKWSLINMV